MISSSTASCPPSTLGKAEIYLTPPAETNILFVGGDVLDAPFKTIIANLTSIGETNILFVGTGVLDCPL